MNRVARRISARLTLKALQRCIDKYPDLRLGQIIVNATAIQATSMLGSGTAPVFYIENEDLTEKLNKFLQEGKL